MKTNNIASSSIIYPNVILGENVTIEDFCIVGCPFKNYKDEKTIIGDNSYIRSHTIIYAGNTIGSTFQTGNKANIRELNTIGDNVSVGTLTVIEHHVKIGNNVRIHSQVFIPEFSILEHDCWIGPKVVMTNAKFPQSSNVKKELKGPIIKTKAKIGANSTILPGIIIGKNCLIGAGSLVSKNTKQDSIYYGHPAIFVRKIDY